MPFGDRTGPMGQGPMTGRGLGFCGQGGNRAYGRGFGRGFGYRRFYTQREEGEMIESEVQELEQELKAAKERLGELKSKK